MGFSKETFEQYRREIRIMWRVLAVGAVLAGGAHIASLPWISRMVSGLQENASSETEAIPIEIFVEEEVVQQTPDPEPEPPEENPEPAASAQRPSAAPLATNTEPLPTNEVVAADTVAVSPSIATENGEVDGQGAVGTSEAIGLVPGTGEPTESGDRINLPDIAPEPPARPREAVQSITARPPGARLVSCNPCTLPDYPASARREELEGQPTINVIFDENGRVIDAVVETSSGNAAFDQAALEEAKKNWRFQDSQGLGGQVSVDVTYVIDDSEQYEAAQQVGEVRAVNLPVDQIRGVTPDQSPSAASAAADTNEAVDSHGIDASSPHSTPTSASLNAPLGSELERESAALSESAPATPASPSAGPVVSDPVASEPVVSEPAASEPVVTQQPVIPAPVIPQLVVPEPVAPAPATSEPVMAPQPVVPEPVAVPASPEPQPSAPPVVPAADPATPPDILPKSNF